MPPHAVDAEYDPLESVRLHTPGIELLSGSLDPAANLFDEGVPPDQARAEHAAIERALDDAGVEVHQLADDIPVDVLDSLVREAVTVDGEPLDLDRVLESFSPHEKLQLVLGRVTLKRHGTPDGPPAGVGGPREHPPTSVLLDRPISNIYFQRDTTLLGDRGPVLCNMYEPARRPEVDIVREAWEGVGADIAHEVTDEPIEGGEFIPAGEFALLGVSALVDGEEVVIRTSYDAGVRLMEAGAVGYDEFGLVRAPIEADRKQRAETPAPSRVMHLLGWFNIAAEGLCVLDETLAAAASVDVYARSGESYRKDRSTTVLEYVREKGYDVIAVAPGERWPTNFLAVDDGVVVPIFEGGDGGEYRPEENPTIEAMRDRGVEVLPDGTGLEPSSLIKGAGGIHCMTTPLGRG